MNSKEIKDFTELTCTNLMIKLKILLNKLPNGNILSFYATREQVDNTCIPFSRQGYHVEWEDSLENRHLVRMKKP
jgi:TusA-related sulfurtransferase